MLSQSLRAPSRAVSRRCFSSSARPLSALAGATKQTLTQSWQGTAVDGSQTLHLIGGEYTAGDSTRWIDVHNPATNQGLTRVPEATPQVLTRAVDKAEEAFDQWKDASVLKRQAVMLK